MASTTYSANDLASLPLNYAKIAVSSNGVNEVVAAVTGKKIVVMQFWASCSAALNAKWQTKTSDPTDLTGLLYGTTDSGISCPWCPGGAMATNAGENLGLNLSTGSAVGGGLVYVLA